MILFKQLSKELFRSQHKHFENLTILKNAKNIPSYHANYTVRITVISEAEDCLLICAKKFRDQINTSLTIPIKKYSEVICWRGITWMFAPGSHNREGRSSILPFVSPIFHYDVSLISSQKPSIIDNRWRHETKTGKNTRLALRNELILAKTPTGITVE